MRLAVLSDIHANLEALTAVLGDVDAVGADQVVHLGDAVGYGPQPQAVVDLMLERGIASVIGNHEWGMLTKGHREWFNPQARQALEWTMAQLRPETLDLLTGLPAQLVVAGARCVHGCPPASMTRYLFEVKDRELARIMDRLPQTVSFVGHTHELGVVSLLKGRLTREELTPGVYPLLPQGRYVFNVGAVGQPRDGDPAAKWALWDDEERTLEVRRVVYDHRTTAAKVRAAGLPEAYARRLGPA